MTRICGWMALALTLTGIGLTPARGQDPKPAPPSGKRVFIAGHSFHVMIAGPLAEMAKAGQIKDHELVGLQFLGGSRTLQHWELADDKNKAKQALNTGKVDVLTLSPHLKIPDEGIDRFTELALKNNPAARVMVQASWYPYDLPNNLGKNFKNDERNEATIDALRKGYETWHKEMQAQVQALNEKYKEKYKRQVVFLVPVGPAVINLREKVVAGKCPGIEKQAELFTDPIGHARPPVAILAAYCHYAAIYGRSPVGLPTPATLARDKSVKEADKLNTLLQEIAWETVTKHPLSGVKPQEK